MTSPTELELKMYEAYDAGYQIFLKNWQPNRQAALESQPVCSDKIHEVRQLLVPSRASRILPPNRGRIPPKAKRRQVAVFQIMLESR